MKTTRVSRELAGTYYLEHKGKPFFPGLVKYITSGPSVALVLEGDGAVAVVRKMMGKTNAAEAEPGTIRGDFGITIGRNLIHGSDSVPTAKREIRLFFTPGELLEYGRLDETWLYE
jgi:nucleoside-diphosphate kinase